MSPEPARFQGWRAQYEPAVDGLRAIAILGVLVAHAQVGFVHGGDEGVTVFFVISGFLITGLLLAEHARTGTLSLRAFYRRRFARLMPVFIAAMLVTTAVLLILGYGLGEFWEGLATSLTYTSNFLYAAEAVAPGSPSDHYFRHTFSLAIEEQFYFLWPLVLLTLLRRPRGLALLLGLTALLVIGPIAWRHVLVEEGAHFWRIKHGTDTRVDALMLGCLIALAMAAGRLNLAARHAALLAWIGILGVLITLVRGHLLPFDGGGYTSSALAAGAAIAGVVFARQGRVARALGHPVLNYVGRRSYSLYLWNVVLLALWFQATDEAPAQTPLGILWLAATLAASELSYRGIERPLRLRLRGPHPVRGTTPPIVQAQS